MSRRPVRPPSTGSSDPADVAGTVHDRVAEILGAGTPADVVLARRMVLGFPAKAERLLGELDGAVETGARGDAVRAVHTLKGTALNLGLPVLAEACQALEDAVVADRTASALDRRTRVLELVAAGSELLDREGRALPEPPP